MKLTFTLAIPNKPSEAYHHMESQKLFMRVRRVFFCVFKKKGRLPFLKIDDTYFAFIKRHFNEFNVSEMRDFLNL